MLTLGRTPNQRIVLSDGTKQITITLVAARSGRARIGIDAPQEFQIWREHPDGTKQGSKATDGQ